MTCALTFFGAAGTVTGSKYLVELPQGNILVDCGMFQGDRSWREKNWAVPGFDVTSVQLVLITHAHIDHIGLIPRYFKLGLRCPILCNSATAALARVLLLDSARLQEEEALYRAESGKSRHHPPLPLYTEADAQGALELLKVVPSNRPVELFPGVTAEWRPMGHIIGASSISLDTGAKRIVFSGDIGRYTVPILKDPEPVTMGDLLLIESTYGDRLHSPSLPTDLLAEVVTRTARRGGAVVIPSFAVGRTQTLLFYLRELKAARRIPDIPVIVDSPMAGDATSIYQANPADYDEESLGLLRSGHNPFIFPKLHFTRDRYESIKMNRIFEPMIIVSASGMLTGGRILHHLKHRISDSRNTILFVGFQPPGSRGDWIKGGAKTVTLLGEEREVRAEVAEISGLSAHADRDELLRWCKSCSGQPARVAVVHGETASATSFAATLKSELQWNCFVAEYQQRILV